MLETRVRVVRIEGPTVWVEPESKQACEHCETATQCGTGLLARHIGSRGRRIAMTHLPATDIGDELVLGISDGRLLQVCAVAYLLPVLTLIVPAAVCGELGLSSGVAALAGALGLVAGLHGADRMVRRSGSRYQPRLLRRSPWRPEPSPAAEACPTADAGEEYADE